MKKLALFLISIATFLFILSSAVYPALAADDWRINSFDADIAIQANGEVLIKETIAVTFDEERHGIYRDLPYVYSKDGGEVATEIAVEAVSRDGTEEKFVQTKNRVNTRLRLGNEDVNLTGDHTYALTYRVRGVIQGFEAYDELYWNVTGNQWEVPLQAISATVHVPQPGIVQFACYQGSAGSTEACPGTKVDEQTLHFATNLSGAGEGMTVAVGITKGMVPLIVITPPPPFIDSVLSWPTFAGLIVVLVAGLGLLVAQWNRNGRDQWFGNTVTSTDISRVMPIGRKEAIGPEYESPEGLRPAEIGVLLDERADTLDVTSTIVDLASRGYLDITQEEKKWLFGSKDYLLTQKKQADKALLAYEKSLLGALFDGRTEVRLSGLKNTFYSELAKIKTQLYKHMVEKGLFAANPESVRNKYIFGGIGIMVLSVAMSAVWWDFIYAGGVWLLGGLAGLFVVGFCFLVFSGAMPARTAKGRMLYRQALGYKLFLSSVDKYRAPFYEKQNIFNEVLPYAVVFGVTDRLAKGMEKIGAQPHNPGWYHGVHPFVPTAFASDINHFSTTLSSAMASAPSSSGSGGGGFSGGGFGGGGGGSW